MTAHCPSHGDVIPVRHRCPWGCGHEFPPEPFREMPMTDPRIEIPAMLASGSILFPAKIVGMVAS